MPFTLGQWSERVLAEVDALMADVAALRGDDAIGLRLATSLTLSPLAMRTGLPACG